MDQKNILLLFLVGDLPTYMIIVELKAENPNTFCNKPNYWGISSTNVTFMLFINVSKGKVLLILCRCSCNSPSYDETMLLHSKIFVT